MGTIARDAVFLISLSRLHESEFNDTSRMNRRRFLSTLGAASLGSFLPWAAPAWSPERRPNVVFLLVDDLGWTDLGCYGNDLHDTPTLDHLAEEGVRYTNTYAAAPNCSPTRASILTGYSPAALNITDYIPSREVPHAEFKPPEGRYQLPPSPPTLAARLGEAGYTSSSIGKWHLGDGEALPTNRGFDTSHSPGHQHHESMFPPYGVPGLDDAADDAYLTDLLARAALSFVREHADEPIFLYLPHYAVHRPHEAKPGLLDKYRERVPKGKEDRAIYAAMVEAVDQAVCQVVDTLRAEGVWSNTLLFLTSDNGPTDVSLPNPLRGQKGTMYEGGLRGPGVESGIVDTPVISHDLPATVLDAVDDLSPTVVEGWSLQSLLQDRIPPPREALFWHFPHYSWRDQRPVGAVRRGRYKLIDYYGCDEVELYDLERDIGKSNDRSADRPERVERLRPCTPLGASESTPSCPHPTRILTRKKQRCRVAAGMPAEELFDSSRRYRIRS